MIDTLSPKNTPNPTPRPRPDHADLPTDRCQIRRRTAPKETTARGVVDPRAGPISPNPPTPPTRY